MFQEIPSGMSRRHFLSHMAMGSAATLSASFFLNHLRANAAQVKSNQRACILIWLDGGAPTIDMWDLKPGSKNKGDFDPISTAGDLQISDQLPEIAKVMDKLSVVRSMSTREADHMRGKYYMHSAYVPNPTVLHPSFGSVVSHELSPQRPQLEIPAYISIGGASMDPGFLGMSNAPFIVDRQGRIQNAELSQSESQRLGSRLQMLSTIEQNFIKSNRGDLGIAHREVYDKAASLMKSQQMQAFKIEQEPQTVRDLYGNHDFGDSLLMARRLVETGVPFVEVQFPNGWDLHSGAFTTLRNTNLPKLDTGIAGLTRDLEQRGMLQNVTIVCMGEFGRTPNINQNVGRDHWASCWSLLVGGGGLRGGIAVGATSEDGTTLASDGYLPGDLWATVAHSLKIPLNKVHTSKRGRPMPIANGGQPIKDLIS